MKEFNLSDKIKHPTKTIIGMWIHEDDVKEFIRRLKEELKSIEVDLGQVQKKIIFKKIDKLAGDKLK